MTKAEKIKNLWKEWMLALAAVAALTMVCNLIGYGGNLAESIPGMVILCFISLLGPGCFLSFAKNPRVLPKTCIAGRRLIK